MQRIPYRELSRFLREVAAPADTATVEEVVAYVARAFDTPYVGVTLIREGGRRFEAIGASHDAVRRAAELQHVLQDGPCVDPPVASRTEVSERLAADPRWPRWAPRAAALGLGSFVASEIHCPRDRIGLLAVFGAADRTFSRDDVELAHVLATHAGTAVQTAGEVDGFTVAPDTRILVGQAQGIVMNQFRLDADRALSALRHLSHNQGISLVRLAQQIVSDATADDDNSYMARRAARRRAWLDQQLGHPGQQAEQ